ncbi:MAG: alpha/beta fold hydrolase [Planctomycetota bacterium]|nr:alpha/beta fold hydrolase [Planctomycetota bacterium]
MIKRVVLLLLALPSLAMAQGFSPPEDISFHKDKIMSEGVRLGAEVFSLKANTEKKLPTIVMCHGWGGTARALRSDAVVFARAGYLVVTFDYRGWGASDGRIIRIGEKSKDGSARAVKELREVVDPIEQTTDLLNAIHWVQEEKQCDRERIGLWGSSFSGGHVVYAAARDPRVKATVSQVPAFDGRWAINSSRMRKTTYGGATQRARGKAGYPEPGEASIGKLKGAPILEKIGRYAPVEDAARLKGCAALFILAENEELFDNKEHGILAHSKAKGPKKLVIVPEIKHYGIYREAKKQAQGLAIAWYDEHLKK